MGLSVLPIPYFSDNYAYLLRCEDTGQTAVIDPGDGERVLEVLEQKGLELHAIFNTHHHWDHTGGNSTLLARFPGIPLYGAQSDAQRIEGMSQELRDGDIFRIGKVMGRARMVPGHTLGAVAYIFQCSAFTGDTLFAGGCGRIFEGTAEMMYRSLNEVLGGLPPETLVFCGHEYTQANLRFACLLEPNNDALAARSIRVDELREKGEATLPSTIADELATNPFLRCDSAELLDTLRSNYSVEATSPIEILAEIRRLKDSF